MKKRRNGKLATVGLIVAIIIGGSSYVSAASGHAFCAGYKANNDIDTTSAVVNAYNAYKSLGYTSHYVISPSYGTLSSGKFSDGTKYLESKVVLLDGHGNQTGTMLQLSSGGASVVVGNSNNGYYVGTNDINLKKVNLVTLAGCNTSATDNSLAVNMYEKGARNTIGWRQSVQTASLTEFLKNYNKKLATGASIWDALVYAGSFSYNDTRVKDVGFFGSASNSIKSVNNLSTMTVNEEVNNSNTTYVSSNITFKNNEQGINILMDFISSKNPSFKKEDYDIKINELNKEQELYIIDVVKKFDNFYTNLGYVITIRGGKVETITDNNKSVFQKSSATSIKNSITVEELDIYKKEAIVNLMKKLENNTTGNKKIDNKDLKVNEQICQLYFDVDNNKHYYKVFTTYEKNGFIDVDYYVEDLDK